LRDPLRRAAAAAASAKDWRCRFQVAPPGEAFAVQPVNVVAQPASQVLEIRSELSLAE
jgi:hypothetical protein